MAILITDKMRNNYTKYGKKNPIIVLLHGWGESKETWKDISRQLCENYTVYALDLPAFGDNQKRFTIFSHEDYVIYLNDFFLEHKIDNCILLGHSFGGRVAALFAIRYPKKVNRLILYSSNIRYDMRPYTTLSVLKSIITKSLVLIFSVITRGLKNKKILMNDYRQLSKIQNKLYTGREFVNVLGQVKQPVLLIAGRFDFLSTLSYQKLLAKQFTNGTLIIFDRSTHIAHIEERNKFVKTLKVYIR